MKNKWLKPTVLMMLTGSFLHANVMAMTIDQLSPVIVSATRLQESLTSVPAGVSVLTKEDIQNRRVNSITDILEGLPGVFASQAAEGGITMRGFDSTDILVMKDGQIMNNAWDGRVDWNLIPVENIQRIEVVRGAGSSLYGGRAVGGVINIMTKDLSRNEAPIEEIKGKVSLSYGTYGTKKGSFQIQVDSGKEWYGTFGLDHKKTNGFAGFRRTKGLDSEKSTKAHISGLAAPKLSNGKYLLGGRGEKGWENKSYHLELGYRLDEEQRIEYDYQKSDYSYSYANPFSYVKNDRGEYVFSGVLDGGIVKGKQRSVTFNENDFLGYYGKRQVEVQSLQFVDDAEKLNVKFGYSNYYGNGYSSAGAKATIANGGAGDLSWYPSQSYTFEANKTWEIGAHQIVAGLYVNRESFVQNKMHLANYRVFDFASEVFERHGGKGLNKAAFVQDKIQLDDDWALYVGARYDYYKKYDGFSYIKKGNINLNHASGTFSQLSPKFVVEYAINEDSKVYASYGKSFAPPVLYKVYRQSGMLAPGATPVLANPDLRPECSTTYELGYKTELNANTSLDINMYRVNTKDKIQYVDHKTFKRYDNKGNSQKEGMEVSLRHEFNKQTSAYINYAWQQSITDEKRDFDIPKHVLHMGLQHRLGKMTILVDGEYVSTRQQVDLATGEYGSADPYFLTNLSVNYQIKPDWNMQVAINNVLAREFFDNENTAGRTVSVTTRYNF